MDKFLKELPDFVATFGEENNKEILDSVCEARINSKGEKLAYVYSPSDVLGAIATESFEILADRDEEFFKTSLILSKLILRNKEISDCIDDFDSLRDAGIAIINIGNSLLQLDNRANDFIEKKLNENTLTIEDVHSINGLNFSRISKENKIKMERILKEDSKEDLKEFLCPFFENNIEYDTGEYDDEDDEDIDKEKKMLNILRGKATVDEIIDFVSKYEDIDPHVLNSIYGADVVVKVTENLIKQLLNI